jgi:very-short-patch-repair endonuclease
MVLKTIHDAYPGLELELEVPMYEAGKTPRTARRYKVDIFIPILKIAIEVDGEHHFKPIDYDGNQAKSVSKYERRKMLDNLKNYYASLLGWRLVRLKPEDVKSRKVLEYIKLAIEEELNCRSTSE